MNGCINTALPEYQALKRSSGISDFALQVEYRKRGRLPRLDEIPHANSEPALKEDLKLSSNNVTSLSHIQETTGKLTVPEMNEALNDKYLDLETQVIPMKSGAIVKIEHRPTEYVNNLQELEEYLPQEDFGKVNLPIMWETALAKLLNLYGIPCHAVTTFDIQNSDLRNVVANAPGVNAFIYNNEIYVNVDNASIDAPIHELLHIFVGSLRFKNPELYKDLLQVASQIPDLENRALLYPNRTENDVLEEIFVNEFSRFITGHESVFNKLSATQLYDVLYNINRILDSILMGKYSSKAILPTTLMNLSLRDLAMKLHSAMGKNIYQGTINDALAHRILQNEKSELMKSKQLTEMCL